MSDVETTSSEIRDDKGRFKRGVSGNVKGRPRNTKGNKHKHAKQTLETMLMSTGPAALKAIKKMADEELAKGNVNHAFKCYVFIADKYYQLVMHNDKVEIQAIKDEEQRKLKAQQQQDEDSEEDSTFQNVIVTFGSA
jgi:hypothetical protein